MDTSRGPKSTELLTSDNPRLSESKNSFEKGVGGFAIDCKTEVRRYVRNALAGSTRRAYRADLEHFLAWGGTVPCSDEAVAAYLADHAKMLAIATLERRLVSIGRAQAAKGLQSPVGSALVQSTMRGIKREHGTPQRRARTLLVEDLFAILASMGDGPKDVRDRALLLLAFAAALRRSEVVAVDCKHLEFVRQGLVLTVPRSKADPAGKGRRIGLPFARGHYCPVYSLEAWQKLAGIEEGPVFRPVTRHGTVVPSRLSTEAVGAVVKGRVSRIGHDPALYSGHSLRAGLATSAARAGVSSWKIRAQTGHASDAMLQRYIREGNLFEDNAAGALL